MQSALLHPALPYRHRETLSFSKGRQAVSGLDRQAISQLPVERLSYAHPPSQCLTLAAAPSQFPLPPTGGFLGRGVSIPCSFLGPLTISFSPSPYKEVGFPVLGATFPAVVDNSFSMFVRKQSCLLRAPLRVSSSAKSTIKQH